MEKEIKTYGKVEQFNAKNKEEKEGTMSLYEKLKCRERKVVLLTEPASSKTEQVAYRLNIRLPDLFPAHDILFDREALIKHLESLPIPADGVDPDFDWVLAALQAGFDTWCIQVWSKARPKAPRQDGTGGDDIHAPDYPAIAQARINAYHPDLAARPKVKHDKAAIQAQANITAGITLVTVLKAQGMDINAITAMVTSCYPAEVSQIMEEAK